MSIAPYSHPLATETLLTETGSDTVLGSEVYGYAHDSGMRVLMSDGGLRALEANPALRSLIDSVCSQVIALDGFRKPLQGQSTIQVSDQETGWGSTKNKPTSVYSAPEGAHIKAFDNAHPHDGLTEFAVANALAERLRDTEVRHRGIPIKGVQPLALLQSPERAHQTMITATAPGKSLARLVRENGLSTDEGALVHAGVHVGLQRAVPHRVGAFINDIDRANNHSSWSNIFLDDVSGEGLPQITIVYAMRHTRKTRVAAYLPVVTRLSRLLNKPIQR